METAIKYLLEHYQPLGIFAILITILNLILTNLKIKGEVRKVKADIVISYFNSELKLLQINNKLREIIEPIFNKILVSKNRIPFEKNVEKFKWNYLLKLEDYFQMFEALYRNDPKKKIELIETKLFDVYELMVAINRIAKKNHKLEDSQFGGGDFDVFVRYIHKNTNPIFHSYIRKHSNESIRKILSTLPDDLKLNVTIIDSIKRRFISFLKKTLFVANYADNYK